MLMNSQPTFLNIKGNLYIEDVEVHKQIMAALAEK